MMWYYIDLAISPQSVTEKLICQSVIGRNPHKEKIMAVEVTGHFITPLLQFSKKELKFTTEQVRGKRVLSRMSHRKLRMSHRKLRMSHPKLTPSFLLLNL